MHDAPTLPPTADLYQPDPVGALIEGVLGGADYADIVCLAMIAHNARRDVASARPLALCLEGL